MMPLLACGVGIYIGLNFNILALVPLSIVAGTAALAASWLSGQGLFGGNHLFLLPLMAIQAGYMIGLTARDAVAQLRLRANPDQAKRL